MPKRIVLQTVILTRKNGETGANEKVKPAIGSEFNFTQAEIDQLTKLNPDAIGKIITKDGGQSDVETITLTPAELEQQKQDALNAQRDQMEKDIRAQLEKEAAAKAETDAKTETDAKVKGKGKGKEDATNTDDDI